MRIGLLTGGGDCPGLNAAIRAIVRMAELSDDAIVGFRHGWRGVVEGESEPLSTAQTKGILQRGGTILGTARYHPDEHPGAASAVLAAIERTRLDAVIVLGGDGTLASSQRLSQLGAPIIGIPKTIDNDVMGTQRCIGFDTAVATAADAIDRVHTTGESHDRLMVVEVMGRTTGWLAVCAGIAAGADAICLPEAPTDLDTLAKAIQRRHDAGSSSSVVVVAEGARLERGSNSAAVTPGMAVSSGLAERTGYETRLTVLGHIQRGGAPTASDRLLATDFGIAAIEAVHAHAFGTLVAVLDDQVVPVPLGVVTQGARPVTARLLTVAERLTVGPLSAERDDRTRLRPNS